MDKIGKQLLKDLSENMTEGVNEFGEKYEAVQILQELKKLYSSQLKPEILSVRMYQTEKVSYLEITERLYPNLKYDSDIDLETEELHKTEISFKTVREPMGSIEYSLLDNAYYFIIEYDDYSKANTTDLFTEEGSKELISSIGLD